MSTGAPSDDGRRILLADENPARQFTVTAALTAGAFQADVTGSGAWALDRYRRDRHRLVMLSASLPHFSGAAICRFLRARSPVPIIVLTATNDEDEVVEALEAGADDCVMFTDRRLELLARVRAAIRRAEDLGRPAREPVVAHVRARGVYELGDVRLDTTTFDVAVGGRPVSLTLKEFDLLALLMANPGRTVSREAVIAEVWGPGAAVSAKSLSTHIRRLRRKLGDDRHAPARIVSVRGFGYRFGS